MPNTCSDCIYFEPEPHTSRGNCHGVPPTMVESTVTVPHNRRTYIAMRPTVAPADRACSLFAPIVAPPVGFGVLD